MDPALAQRISNPGQVQRNRALFERVTPPAHCPRFSVGSADLLQGSYTPQKTGFRAVPGRVTAPGSLHSASADSSARRATTALGSLNFAAGCELGVGRYRANSGVGSSHSATELGERRPSDSASVSSKELSDGQDLNSRIARLTHRNDMLSQEMMLMQQRMQQEEEIVTAQKEGLLEQTDQLLIQTDRIDSWKEELKQREAVLKGEAQEFLAVREKNDELMSEMSALQNNAADAEREVNDQLHLQDEWQKEKLQLCDEIASLKAERLELNSRLEETLNVSSKAMEQSRNEDADDLQRQLDSAMASVESLKAELLQERENRQTLELSFIRVNEDSRRTQASLRDELEKQEEAHKASLHDLQQQLEASRMLEDESKRMFVRKQVELDQLTMDFELAQQRNSVLPEGVTNESRLRQVMNDKNASSDEYKSAIGSVEALMGEARRELDRKVLSERRAAYEELFTAIDKADEMRIEKALVVARKVGMEVQDLEKGEEKLKQLQEMTDEEKAARDAKAREQQLKKDAFLLVKKDNADELKVLIDGLGEGVRWMDWRDYAGRTLWKLSQDLRAERVQPVLSSLLGLKPSEEVSKLRGLKAAAAQVERGRAFSLMSSCKSESEVKSIRGSVEDVEELATPTEETPSCVTDASDPTSDRQATGVVYDEVLEKRPMPSAEELAELKQKAFRSVVQDKEQELLDVLELVPQDIWSAWKNKAGKDLLLLSEERGSDMVHGALLKALGLLEELKRDTFEEGEDVWIYTQGDVQPRRAKIMQDTPEEDDKILIEYWDGDDPESFVDRCQVRKDYT